MCSRRATPAAARAPWVFLAVGLVVLVTACGTDEPTDPVGELGVGHVHGLGINPADGDLYAASHHGVFRITEASAHRMGPLIQDTMGLTVAGPDRFLGSGHPDVRNDPLLDEDMTPLLGLIESDDAGATWQARSLQGEVDFHALAFSEGKVLGADASGARFLVSQDLETWETRSQIALWSFAVAPDDADTIVGITEESVVVSSDGGRAWRAAEGSPRLSFVSWDRAGGLWGVTADGSLYRSEDGGSTWDRRGSAPGEPTAMLAAAGEIYVATTESIVRSDDEAATWDTLRRLT